MASAALLSNFGCAQRQGTVKATSSANLVIVVIQEDLLAADMGDGFALETRSIKSINIWFTRIRPQR
jgi:hypothetical protein